MSIRRFRLAWFALASLIVLVSAPGLRAAADAVVSGTVVDPLGGRIPGATVTLVRDDGASVATTTTDGVGEFVLAQVEGGRYRLRVGAPGFASRETQPFFVSESAHVATSVPLQVGQIVQEAVVTASAAELPASQVGASVTVVGRESLEAAGRLGVADAIRTVPGVQVVQSGPRGGRAAVFLRGGNSDFVKVLVDGVPVNDLGGAIDFADLQSTAVERVEVLRGPNSVLYGADALSGVVSVTTRRGLSPTPEMTYAVEGGTFSTARHAGSIGGGAGRLDYFGAYSHLATDNDGENSAFRNDTLSSRIGVAVGSSSDVTVTVRHNASRLGLPNAVSYLGLADDSWQSTRLTSFGTAVRTEVSPRLTTIVRGVAADQSLALTNPAPTGEPYDPFGFGPNYLGEPVTIRAANGTTATGRAIIDFGGAYPQRYHAGWTRRALYGQADYTLRPGLRVAGGLRYDWERGYADSGLRTEAARHNVGAFAEIQAAIRRLFVNAGLGVDHHAVFGAAVVPRLSVAVYLREPSASAVWGETKWTMNAGRGVKAPSLLQELSSLHEVVAAGAGSPLAVAPIGPERSTAVDIGLEQALFGGDVRVRGAVFASRYRDLIEFVDSRTLPGLGVAEDVAAATGFGAYVNASSFDASGVELSGDAAIGAHVRVSASYLHLRAEVTRSFSGSALSPAINPAYPDTPIGAYAPLVGGRPFRRPAHSGSLAVAYASRRVDALVSAFWSGTYDDSTFLSDADFGSSLLLPNRGLAAGYATVDASASYAVTPAVSATLTIENLLDRRYEAVPGFPSLPRAVRAGLRLSLGGARSQPAPSGARP